MNKPLSNEEIEQAIGPCVVLYSDLEKYPTIQTCYHETATMWLY